MALLERLQKAAQGQLADILAAQREMLDDPELKQGAIELIASGSSAEAAIARVAARYADQLASLPDAYLAARSEDIREVGRRIVAELRGTSTAIVLTQPTILVAQDLAPAELAGLDPALLQAIVTETGSATGHLAIVAQGLDIPAVVGITDALSQVDTSTTLIVDGENGIVTINPDSERRDEAEKRLREVQRERRHLEIYRDRPGLTADGTWVEVFANIGSLAEARKAVEMGAEGVGLFRTEFIAAQGLPSEEAQYAIYTEIAATLCSPLIVRTFDIGGDKPVPGLDIPAEANPFLGWRGIRLGLDQPEKVFLPQIRALLRAAATHDIRIMLPMVTTPQEVEAARALINQASLALAREGYETRPVRLGIMVETPAAALTLDLFTGLIDFASIGTNDLVQYTYAVDRTNARVRARAQPLGVATLRLVQQICLSGIPIAVCGQMASDPSAIPLLVGLGVRELSVSPARVPAVKQALAALTLEEMRARAQIALGSS
jgi:phosphoenolpyruvate-protein phosphotransferase